MWWQAEFLRYTYMQTGMHAELTALVAATEEPEYQFSCNTVRVANYKNSVPNEPLLVLRPQHCLRPGKFVDEGHAGT